MSPDKPGGGKVPLIAWAEYQTRRPTEAELRAWFATGQNLAIICGAVSGVVAIDADSTDAVRWCVKNLPRTAWQTKTSRGYHLFYRHPEQPIRNRSKVETRDGKLPLDVRGDGGYVIAPGSIHYTGALYQFAGDWSVSRAKIPTFWPGWLERPRLSRPPSSRPRPTGDAADRARRYLTALPQPVLGNGSDEATFYAACRLVRGFGLSIADAVALLVEWCPADFDREWIEAKAQHAEAYGEEEVGGLR